MRLDGWHGLAMRKRSSTTAKHINQLAAHIVALSTSEEPEVKPESTGREKNAAAVALGKLGGIKGGKARAQRLSAEKRKEIAKKAAEKRWGKK